MFDRHSCPDGNQNNNNNTGGGAPRRRQRTRSCYNCQQEGHLARDCPEESNQGSCYNCSQTGILLLLLLLLHCLILKMFLKMLKNFFSFVSVFFQVTLLVIALTPLPTKAGAMLFQKQCLI